MKKSLYATLGIDPKSSEGDIRVAYEARLAATSPDDAITRLALKEAWNVLGHTQRRAVYDASLHEQAAREAAKPQSSSGRPSGRPSSRSRAAADNPGKGKIWLAAGAGLLVLTAWLVLRHGHAGSTKADSARQSAVRLAQMDPGATINTASTNQLGNGEPAQGTPPAAPPVGRVLSPEQLFAQISPSVMRINVLNDAGDEVGHGSGVVIERGKVITNCHVAKAGPRLKVKHQNNQYDASIQVNDEQHDLCKLTVFGLDAPPVQVGKVAGMHVGQKVYAIGSPQGLDLTLSDGMVSSLREGEDGTFIQTTAPISPGSSGGGLFNERGVLVGIVTFQMRSGQNLNFAIPADWIDRMSSNTVATRSEPGGDPNSPARAILGTWHCFGPLTGRGMDVTLDEQGNARGSFDGQPIGGRYYLNNKQLTLMGNSFLVEELSPSRMVLSKGQGRRLACNH
ncbi:MAG TPA: trypsin-like peptidase domain-containing protein [Aquabacterium sp.]|uniref:trypsin-like peptidase domain-containing protein n=1 Tax=Aquabacterium sp. TaxID=1872578 RepID=UPI002E342E0F|nr:trypsin-like peptidase domain-containing protein [Aquabacterium sp.]HEX5356051.1 trypsin-like peptidase domain-containing protein [Aquabacterium sp.]